MTSAFLLPGMMCDGRLFSHQRAALRAAFGTAFDATLGPTASDAARIIEADMTAHDSIEAMAEAAMKQVPDEQIVAIGLSMGGIVAMECLRQAPERMAALVLMDTNPRAEMAERRAARLLQIERALQGELDAVLVEEMKPLYLAPSNRDDETLLGLVLDMARTLGPAVFAAQSMALAARRDYRQTLARWRGPTLLLCGEHDALCPPERHREMHSLMPQAELVLVPDAGHLPTLEQPNATTDILLGFLGTGFFGNLARPL